MELDPSAGLLVGAHYEASPNCDERPAGTNIDLLVIHGMSLPPGEFGGPWISDLFNNRLNGAAHPYFETIHQLHLSSHLLIRRDGSVLQFVPFQLRAWHAGASCYQGRTCCNDFSIGIELEGTDEIPYESMQYQRLAEITLLLIRNYPMLSKQHIVGHSDIAPGRKTDPGPAFDWDRYRLLLGRLGA